MRTRVQSIFAFCLMTVPVMVLAQTGVTPDKADLPEPEKIYSPYVERTATDSNFAEGLYWGDSHLHTRYSTDSGMIGNKLGPEEAYRFALGEVVTTSSGQRARLIRPLDFLVVSDHAENLGLAPMIAESNPELLKSEWGREIHDMVKAGKGYEAFIKWGSEAVATNTDQINNPKMQRTVWDRQIAAAEKFNDPGQFTSLIGFEWTSLNNMDNPSNLHRVVLFKDSDEDEVYMPDAVSIGYAKGVPMGGDLAKGPSGKAPVFMVGALKDPSGANLDRIQIVKGWVDEKGERQERIYDVAVSDDRTIGSDGRCKTPVGNTVDEANASFLNNIGDAELRAVWSDPNFDPKHSAVYYARVLEIPTPTWQAFDAQFFGITMPDDVPLSHQDRAYTSPIWYTP